MRQRTKKIILWGLLPVMLFMPLLIVALGVLAYKANQYRLPEALLKMPLDPPHSLATAPRPSSPAPSLPPIATPEDLLRRLQARAPSQPAAMILMQLLQRYRADNLGEPVRKLIFHQPLDLTKNDPLTPEWARWLSGQAAMLELLHRFCRAEPLPPLTLEEVEASRGLSWRMPNVTFGVMLCAQFKRLNADRDYAGARQALEDMIYLDRHLMRLHPGGRGYFDFCHTVEIALARAVDWAEQPDFPLNELRSLSATMESIERESLTSQACIDAMAEIYLVHRHHFLTVMAQPSWRDPIYGWYMYNGSKIEPPAIHFGRDFSFTQLVELPRCTIRAIGNRLHCAEALREYDRKSLEALALPKEPWAKIRAHHEESLSWGVFDWRNFLLDGGDNAFFGLTTDYAQSMYHDLTRSHLFRLAVAQREDPDASLARRAGAAGDPHSPWRDPYSGGLMQIDNSTSPTMAWSMGQTLDGRPNPSPSEEDRFWNMTIRILPRATR